MMLAFRKLRRIDPDRPRPYRVPGGPTVEFLVTWVPALLLITAAVFFVWNPFDFSAEVTGSILIGLVATFVIQEIFCKKSPEWTRQRAVERGEDPGTASQFSATVSAQKG